MSSFGANSGFVDELYARYLEDPQSVGESWQEFFADYKPAGGNPTPRAPGAGVHAQPAAPTVIAPATGPIVSSGAAASVVPTGHVPAIATKAQPQVAPAQTEHPDAEPLKGIAAKIVENMVASLHVPTATSVRSIPVKLLEENRKLVNAHQSATSGAKVSFTHMVAYALLRAMEKHPGMNDGYVERDGKPHRVHRKVVNLGLAIDLERKGERVLLVPNIKDAGRLNFLEFVAAYDDIVARARNNKLAVDEFQGTTVSITNPGMIGTQLSVPRLMEGQSAIFGIGNIGFPAEYAGMSNQVISELGLSRTMTITSTYDHRVIQGAESGGFCRDVEKLLLGDDRFYVKIFDELDVPYEPLAWAGDQNVEVFGGRDMDAIRKQAHVLQLIRAHRVRGHLYAHLDPLSIEAPQLHPELEMSKYGLTVWDLDRQFMAGELAGSTAPMPLRDIMETLRETYCRHIGVEYMHIPYVEQRDWLQARMESSRNASPFTPEEQQRILKKLNAAEAFERFLHTTYVGQKRFSLEGGETLIPMLDFLLEDAGRVGVTAAVIGMAHRGRLNVLVNTVGKKHESVFREFEGEMDPGIAHGSGDVKYHLGSLGKHVTETGETVSVALASNPSHLEAVNPVVEGMVRAMQDIDGDVKREKTIPILIHGDAAFAGQGVVVETLGMSQLNGYRTGGTVHVVVNNQIGFTTGAKDARSSLYSTDVAKAVHAPIFHVNGDNPEDAVRVMRLAFAFRHQFKRDVVIDLVCYRRWGHNEGDDPSYTQPLVYQRIENHRSVRKIYTEQLLRRGDLDAQSAEKALDDFRVQLQGIHDAVKQAQQPKPQSVARDREDERGVGVEADVERTAASAENLELVLDGLERPVEGFEPHPKLVKQLAKRRERYDSGKIDWALGEALAFGSLVIEGNPVRLSGEDTGRGTFSQRHCILYDHRTGTPYIPLNNLQQGQANFSCYDSLLSEFGVLGFDYGYSVNYPKALVMWEAQFGDFVNGAQVIIDQFISSGEQKWNQKSSVVMLLPHGYEGQGPEHSSARIERFLQLAAAGNWRVCYPTTPAQYFHLLRRQVRSEQRKPCVVFTPKSLLRHPEAVSAKEELLSGSYMPVISDSSVRDAKAVSRVVLCSGKIYYDLDAARREKKLENVAIVRLEQYYPFPAEQLRAQLETYSNATEVLWVQEEPRNMGAWDFVDERLLALLYQGQTLRYVGRPSGSSPATGSSKRHAAEQAAVIAEALEGEGKPALAHGQKVIETTDKQPQPQPQPQPTRAAG